MAMQCKQLVKDYLPQIIQVRACTAQATVKRKRVGTRKCAADPRTRNGESDPAL